MAGQSAKNHVMNWFCSDVQCRGKYPGYIWRYFRENHIRIQMEPQDEQILAQGPVDFYTCSYYMSVCETADPDAQSGKGNLIGGVSNPYLKASDWGCIDLVSASTGEMAKRYGFIFVERYDDGTGDFSRRRKKSFFWYKNVIATNGENLLHEQGNPSGL